jgi:peptidyl-prolyl cis-trans isomerase B (cyclophilin B)
MSPGDRQRQEQIRQRVAQAQERERRARRNQRLLLGAGAVVAVGVLVLLVVLLVVHATSSGTKAATDTTVRPTTKSDFGTTPCPHNDGSSPRRVHFTSAPAQCIALDGHYVADFVTTAGSFKVTLDAAQAPVSVNNFVVLALYHYYDGTTFHRVIPTFVVQGGDPTGDPPGSGSPGYTIADEFPSSVSDYTAGSMAMANTGAPHSGAGQFFIWVGPDKLPSPSYSLFGQVSSGMATVDKIAQGGSASGTPVHPVTIETVTIGQAALVNG